MNCLKLLIFFAFFSFNYSFADLIEDELEYSEEEEKQVAVIDKKTHFAVVKKAEVNLRNGPSEEYRILHQFIVKGVPVQVLYSMDGWTMVKDPSGEVGWIKNALLSLKVRNAMSTEDGLCVCRLPTKNHSNCNIIAVVSKFKIFKLLTCGKTWCRVSIKDQKITGWVQKSKLWGVFPDEQL